MCNNNNGSNKCISEILEVILLLQQNADCGDSCLDTCDRAFLGCGTTCISCNTRPVMLYTCCSINNPLSFPISKAFDEDGTLSATNSFFTINLNCLCSLRCLNDTYIECI